MKKNNKEANRKQYNDRQVDKWVKWSIETLGYVKWKDLIKQQQLNN